ncbi:hypothetical protein HPP92_005582 [Vanilla planifolia]|uniref:Uncharacterized protein n=1 Tax=Vanilla planifolia TaxID=51239 RepID=A0A835VEU6_VANPL|nr:hypothetical protein HPP92_005582 [Vanilla planifolia]
MAFSALLRSAIVLPEAPRDYFPSNSRPRFSTEAFKVSCSCSDSSVCSARVRAGFVRSSLFVGSASSQRYERQGFQSAKAIATEAPPVVPSSSSGGRTKVGINGTLFINLW